MRIVCTDSQGASANPDSKSEEKSRSVPSAATEKPVPPGLAEFRVDELIVKSGALQQVILKNANFPVIATHEKGTIQLFNAGAELIPGYAACKVVDRITPGDISDRRELRVRASELGNELANELAESIAPGMAAGFFQYLTKPIEVDAPMETLDLGSPCRRDAGLSIPRRPEPMRRTSAIFDGKILIVDDQPANIQLLETMLERAGYWQVTSTRDPAAVCALHSEHQFDLILLELRMPIMSGFEVMAALKKLAQDDHLPVLVVTAQPNQKLAALQAGAKDFISKPFDRLEVLNRIHNMLEVRLLNEQVKMHGRFLEGQAVERTADLQRNAAMFRELAANIPDALSIKDVDTQTILFVNAAWSRLTGLRAVPGDEIGKFRREIHPDDLKWIDQERRKTIDETTKEFRLVRPDESVRWVRRRSFPIPNPSGQSPWLVEITEDVSQRREAQRQLVHLAGHDALTGLPNRTLLYESLRDALSRADQRQLTLSVLLLDIDHFKAVNDTFGHAVGDLLLREFAQTVAGCLRPGDAVGRVGGDEFEVVVLTAAGTNGAVSVAKRIQKKLHLPFLLEGKSISVTTSIGIASYPTDATDLSMLVRYADAAMYEAKRSGRNGFCLYTSAMNEQAVEKASIEEGLRVALERDEFVLHYQPKMNIDTGRWTGFEALIRWNRPGHGLVMPELFIPALERMGLIVPVGAWVIANACRQLREWEECGIGGCSIAVNVYSSQMRHDAFLSHVADTVHASGIGPGRLEFEISESTLMSHGVTTSVVLRKLRQLGISISIDDFGTGYFSLAYLRRFKVDTLKMDVSFIRDVTINNDDAAIAATIINMAHSLRLKVIAEGVETREQMEFLRSHGCDEIQGYFLSKPAPAEEILSKYRDALTDDVRLNFSAQTVCPTPLHASA